MEGKTKVDELDGPSMHFFVELLVKYHEHEGK